MLLGPVFCPDLIPALPCPSRGDFLDPTSPSQGESSKMGPSPTSFIYLFF